VDLRLASTLIDVGAGSAVFSLELLKESPKLNCFAIDPGYVVEKEVDLVRRITYLKESQKEIGDIYLFTDVLEHVANDRALLKSYVDTAPINSKFVITVPAFMSLWSGHDVFLKHFRRYRMREIRNTISECGLNVKKSQYLYVPLFPIAWFVRRLPQAHYKRSQLKNHGAVLNTTALWILRLDSLLSRIFPFGISILILAEKANN
jgi:hypothetical protein